jgi:hypothetical protein
MDVRLCERSGDPMRPPDSLGAWHVQVWYAEPPVALLAELQHELPDVGPGPVRVVVEKVQRVLLPVKIAHLPGSQHVKT